MLFHTHLPSPAFPPWQTVTVYHLAVGPAGTDTWEEAAAAPIEDAGATQIIICCT